MDALDIANRIADDYYGGPHGNSRTPTISRFGCEVTVCAAAPLVIFRGTDEAADWLLNLCAWTIGTWSGELGRVHRGFRAGVKAVWQDLEPHLAGRVIAGHSKGGGEAAICAGYCRARGVPIAGLVTFAAPRVGKLKGLVEDGRRYVLGCDPVPMVPPWLGHPCPKVALSPAQKTPDGDAPSVPLYSVRSHFIRSYIAALEAPGDGLECNAPGTG